MVGLLTRTGAAVELHSETYSLQVHAVGNEADPACNDGRLYLPHLGNVCVCVALNYLNKWTKNINVLF